MRFRLFVIHAVFLALSLCILIPHIRADDVDEGLDERVKMYKIEGRIHGASTKTPASVILHGNGGHLTVLPKKDGHFEMYVIG